MKNSFKIFLASSCLLAIAACGGGDGSSSPPPDQPGQTPPADFSGRFEGTEQGSEGGIPIDTTLIVTLAQTGAQVSGNYANGLGGLGSVSGTASGNTLSMTGSDANTGCSFSGTVALNDNRLTGRVTGAETPQCLALDVTIDLLRVTPPPSPPPGPPTPPPPPPSGEPNWSTVTLNLSNGANLQFRVDDNGNFLASPSGGSGRIVQSDLLRLDSRIDAIKEEAHDPFTCVIEIPQTFSTSVSLSFENRSNAVVYRVRSEVNEVCWSGDRLAVELLWSEMISLQGAYD